MNKTKNLMYDAAVVSMWRCLEKVLGDHGYSHAHGIPREDIESFAAENFRFPRDQSAEVDKLLKRIKKKRDRVSHHGEGSPAEPRLDFKEFQKIRDDCVRLEEIMQECIGKTGMTDVLLSDAGGQYTMGNAGDYVKHGMLIIALDWLLETQKQVVHFADPFGGRPWAKVDNGEIIRRLNAHSSVMQHAWDSGESRYYGSGHIAQNKGAHVWVSDRDEHKRSDLQFSGLSPLGEKLSGYGSQSGYGVLLPKFAGEFNLILIDPLGDFMTEDFDELDNAVRAAEQNPHLFVIFFVLDMKSKNEPWKAGGVQEHHGKFMWKRNELGVKRIACSLRCPKIKDKHHIKGESKYEAEVLLISRQIADGNCDDLLGRLSDFADKATEILPLPEGRRVEFWPK